MKQKAFALPDGQVLFIDPRKDSLPLIRELSPGFTVPSVPPLKGFVPNIRKIGKLSLQSKIEQAKMQLNSCGLCGWKCGVDRSVKPGRCGLGTKPLCTQPFTHIGLEDVINPGVSIQLRGCGMRCVFCQANELVEEGQGRQEFIELNGNAWSLVDAQEAISVEFVGGDPTASIPGILEFLSVAPSDFSIPIAWDDSGYGSETAYYLLEGLVDIYVPDFKFGNNVCAKSLSGVDHYWETITAGLRVMMGQNAGIIVRLLVIPSHFECCQKKILRWLSLYRDRVWLSIMDQYLPLHRAEQHSEICRIVTSQEIAAVELLARELGLRDVNKNPESFWN